jgi:hypothetical protein
MVAFLKPENLITTSADAAAPPPVFGTMCGFDEFMLWL